MGGVYKHKGTYGTSYKTDQEGKEMKPVKKMPGARQNFVRSTRVNEKKPKMESFSDLVNLINEEGYKALPKIATYTMKFGDNEVEVLDANHVNDAGMTTIAEEPDSETFEKERKDQMEKMTGKKKGSNLAAAPREPVVQTEELDKHDKPKVKKIISKLKGASDAHAGQAKALGKIIPKKLLGGLLTSGIKTAAKKYFKTGNKTQQIVNKFGGGRKFAKSDVKSGIRSEVLRTLRNKNLTVEQRRKIIRDINKLNR